MPDNSPFTSSSFLPASPLAPVSPPTTGVATPSPLSSTGYEAAPVTPTNPNGATSWGADALSVANAPPASTAMPTSGNVVQLALARNSGAKWFYWIAALSLINSLLMSFGADFSFGLGLGSTLLVDAVAKDLITKQPSLASGARLMEVVLDFLIIGCFALFGSQALRGKKWAFICGGLLLALDTLLVLISTLWFSVAIHIWALIAIYAGYTANQKINAQIAAKANPHDAWTPPLPNP